MTPQEVRAEVDRIIPLPPGFPSMKLIEMRHILAAYLLAGSISQAAVILKISVRTIRNKLRPIRSKGQHGQTLSLKVIRQDKPDHPPEPEIDINYPCHRDFEFWDWYMNQDSVTGSGSYRGWLKHDHKEVTHA